MPTEAEVDTLLQQLPADSFIRCFTDYTKTVTDCPSIFMMHAAIQALLSAAPAKMGIQLGVVQAPNTFTLLVGKSSDSRKTTAINWACRVLNGANQEEYVTMDVASPEGFVRLLGERSHRMVAITEGGDWLNRTRAGAYQNVMRENFVRLYDGQPVSHQVKDKKNSLATVRDHRVSVFMGCTVSHMEEFTGRVDFEGGLFNRFMLVTGERERNFLSPQSDPAGEAWIAQALRQRIEDLQQNAGSFLDLDPGARTIWRDWNKSLKARKMQMSANQQVVVARATTHVVKLLQAIAIDLRLPCVGDWTVPDYVMDVATQIADWAILAVLEVYERIAGSKYEQQRRAVLGVLEHHAALDTLALPYQDIANGIRPRLLIRELQGVLNSMLAEGTIQLWKTPGHQDRFSLYEPPDAGSTDETW